MVWDETRVEKLKTYWSLGLSCSVIADRLGGVTRNAVIGKVHRLGLSGRVTQQRRRYLKKGKPKPPRACKPKYFQIRSDKKPIGPALAVTPLPPEPPAPGKLTALQDLTDNQCRFIYGDPKGSAPWGFCGCGSAPGSRYCAGHHVVVHAGSPSVYPSVETQSEWRGGPVPLGRRVEENVSEFVTKGAEEFVRT